MTHDAALTPLVGSLIFKTAGKLGFDIERDREVLIAALERDELFDGSGDLWEQRYARLECGLRKRIVREAVARLRAPSR